MKTQEKGGHRSYHLKIESFVSSAIPWLIVLFMASSKALFQKRLSLTIKLYT